VSVLTIWRLLRHRTVGLASGANLTCMTDWSDESVSWSQLRSAYGSAEEVGELLSLIELGEDVWGDLINEVLHQGSLCGATAPVICWVIRFLDRGGLTGRSAPVRNRVRRNQTVSQKAWAFSFLSAAATSATSEGRGTPELARGVLDALRRGAALFEKGWPILK
jgi:hypothetical protein